MPIIMAIDPGSEVSTAVIWDAGVDGVIMCWESENSEMCREIGSFCGGAVVCEMVACYGMAVGKEVFETCRWIGRFEERTASETSCEFHTVYRKDCKMNLCHSMRAKDANIRQALIDRFGIVGTKKNPGPLFGISKHGWSALAVAVTYADSLKLSELEKDLLKVDYNSGLQQTSD